MRALRYDCDLPFQDIAATLDLPVGTVSTRLRRALQMLATHLDARKA
ncbi:MAG: RNA polymerase sigma factor [Longimicrobiales bacterium]